MAPADHPPPPAETRREERRRDAAARGRARVTQALLVAGAIATGGATTAMAVARLKNDTVSGRTAAAAAPTARKTAPPPVVLAPSRPPSGPLTQEQESAALARIAATGLPVFCGGRTKNLVALTFDDGPGPYTHYVLKRLRRNRMRATFFLVSRNLGRYGDLVKQELQYGTVADHTRTHPDLAGLSPAAQRVEITGARHAIAAASRRPVELFRPPYGSHPPSVDAIAKAEGLVQTLWTVDSADSLGATAAAIKKNVIAGLRPGAIILMHDNRGQTVRALPAILHAVRRKHLRAVSLPLLLTADPPTPAQLRRGRAGCGPIEPTQLAGGASGG